jgi:hypothetical protein
MRFLDSCASPQLLAKTGLASQPARCPFSTAIRARPVSRPSVAMCNPLPSLAAPAYAVSGCFWRESSSRQLRSPSASWFVVVPEFEIDSFSQMNRFEYPGSLRAACKLACRHLHHNQPEWELPESSTRPTERHRPTAAAGYRQR